MKQKTTDAAAKLEAAQRKILHRVLAGDVTGGDTPDSKVPPDEHRPHRPGQASLTIVVFSLSIITFLALPEGPNVPLVNFLRQLRPT